MKKKVLFMLNDMNVGGTEKAFLNLVDTMSPEEYEVTLLLLRRWGGFLDAVPGWIKVVPFWNFQEDKSLFYYVINYVILNYILNFTSAFVRMYMSKIGLICNKGVL